MKKNNVNLELIWNSVPADYYQKGVKNNLLQRLWHGGKLKAVLSLMNKNHQNILDVGCASGWFLSQVASKYPKAKCTGVDVYKKGIEYGKKTYKSLNLIVADAHKLPFPNKSFDVIICTEVLEHVVNPDKVLIEIKRLLSEDGIVIIEMDTGNILFNIAWFFWTHLRRGVWKDAHINSFNLKKLKKMILDSKFNIKKTKIFNLGMAVVFQVK